MRTKTGASGTTLRLPQRLVLAGRFAQRATTLAVKEEEKAPTAVVVIIFVTICPVYTVVDVVTNTDTTEHSFARFCVRCAGVECGACRRVPMVRRFTVRH